MKYSERELITGELGFTLLDAIPLMQEIWPYLHFYAGQWNI
jgi:hypothetical protein